MAIKFERITMAEHYKIERTEYSGKPHPELVSEMIYWGKVMGDLDMVPYVKGKGWAGNIGFKENDIIWVTPSGCVINDIKVDEIMGIKKIDGRFFYFGHAGKQPSSEWEIYWVLFDNIPGINSILHGHDSSTVEVAEQLRNEYPDKVAITECVTASGSAEFRDDILKIYTDRHFYLVGREHGFFALGKTFKEAGESALSFRKTAIELKEKK